MDRTLRLPLVVDTLASGVAVASTLFTVGEIAADEDDSPGESTIVVSVDSSIGGVGMGVLEDEAALDEFKFNLLRLWFDQRPSIDLFKALEPCLVTRKQN